MKSIFTPCKTLLAGVVFFITTQLNAQAPPEEWHRTFNGPDGYYDEAKFVRLDAQNYVVVTGRSGSGSTGFDVVTQKYAPDSTLLWTQRWNNAALNMNDEPYDMIIAPNGNIYITGLSKSDPDVNSFNSNIFMLALDPSGNFLWSDTIRGSGYSANGNYKARNIGFSLVLDAQGNVYMAGQGMGDGNIQYDQAVLAKYNATGQQLWLKFIDNSNAWSYTDYARSVGIDASGNLYFCGTTTLTTTWMDFAIWKYDSNGNFAWVKTRAGSDNNTSEGMTDIIADAAGNTYSFGVSSDYKYVLMKYDSAGVQQWVYSFDTSSVGISSAFTGADRHFAFDHDGNLIFHAPMSQRIGVAKFTPAGALLWLTYVGGTSQYNNEGYDVQIDNANNIYISGAVSMAGSSYFDLGLMKLDAGGHWLWTVAHNGPGNVNDKGHSMAVAGDGSLYVGGFSNGYSNSADYFLAKYKDVAIGIAHTAPVSKLLSVFPNPAALSLIVTVQPELIGHTYTVIDYTGKQVMAGQFTSAQTHLALDKLSSGIYFLKAGNQSAEPFQVVK